MAHKRATHVVCAVPQNEENTFFLFLEIRAEFLTEMFSVEQSSCHQLINDADCFNNRFVVFKPKMTFADSSLLMSVNEQSLCVGLLVGRKTQCGGVALGNCNVVIDS